MEIGRINNEFPVPLTGDNQQVKKGSTSKAEPRKDGVEISDEARKQLAALADQHLKKMESQGRLPEEPQEKPVDRLGEIRHRMASGFYDSPEMMQEIADRIIDENGLI